MREVARRSVTKELISIGEETIAVTQFQLLTYDKAKADGVPLPEWWGDLDVAMERMDKLQERVPFSSEGGPALMPPGLMPAIRDAMQRIREIMARAAPHGMGAA